MTFLFQHESDAGLWCEAWTYHSLYSGCAFLDRFKDPRGPDDGRVQKILFCVLDIEMKRGRSMNNGFERGIRFDHLVKGGWICDIFHNDIVKFVFAHLRVMLQNVFSFLRRSDTGNYRMSMLEEDVDEVRGNETTVQDQ